MPGNKKEKKQNEIAIYLTENISFSITEIGGLMLFNGIIAVL
jgi:hypothetical protein